jgi:hypothetical protein
MIVYKFRPSDRVYAGPIELPDGPTIPPYHTRTPPPEKDGHYAVMRNGWILVEGAVPDEPTPPEPDLSPIVRAERDAKLKESDWTQLSDAPVDKEAWAVYRQALRDVPQQEGFPHSVTWPEQPE